MLSPSLLPGPHRRQDRVPDPHRRVAGRGGQPGAVATEGDSVDVGLVPAQLAYFFPGGDVPQADRVIAAACCQTCALPTESQAEHSLEVRQDCEFPVRLGREPGYDAERIAAECR